MRVKDALKKENKPILFKGIAKRCFAVCFLLSVLSVVFTFPSVQKNLEYLNAWFIELEVYIAGFNELIAFFIIIALFLFNGFVPVIPLSVLFISSGMVFPAPIAIFVNALGFAIMVSVKFIIGKRFGGGKAVTIVKRYSIVTKFMETDGKHNKWLLVLLRFFSFIPVGLVSRAYGTTDIKIMPYIGLSVVGFLPRLILWSIVGVNVYEPFSLSFTLPLIFLLSITGSAFLVYNSLSE